MNQLKKYSFEYEYNGKRYFLYLEAESFDDAIARMSAATNAGVILLVVEEWDCED